MNSSHMDDRPPSATAAVFVGPGQPFRIEPVPLPEPGPGEALVEVSCCTVCGSDMHSIQGRRSCPAPSILGHEILGRVVALDQRVPMHALNGRRLRVGDRVTWSIACSCGECFSCTHGLPQKCDRLFKYGHQATAAGGLLSGGLATHCLLRSHSQVVLVDESIPDVVACPANCATATVFGALRTAGSLTDAAVLVLGAGMLGVTACAAAREAGARCVIAADLDADRAALAEQFGADRGVDLRQGSTNLQSEIALRTDGRGVDYVLELSGAAESVELGIESLRTGGSIILVGSVFPTRDVGVSPEAIVRRLLRIEGLHNYRPTDLQAAVDFLERHHRDYPFAELVAASFPLTSIDAAIEHAEQQRPFRVAVRPTT